MLKQRFKPGDRVVLVRPSAVPYVGSGEPRGWWCTKSFKGAAGKITHAGVPEQGAYRFLPDEFEDDFYVMDDMLDFHGGPW